MLQMKLLNALMNIYFAKFLKKKARCCVLHVFNPSSQQRQVNLSEFKTSLIYKANFRTAKAVIQRTLVLGGE